MTVIQSLPSQKVNLDNTPGKSSASNLVRESQTTLSRRQDLDVAITTVEGDTFTLSADSEISLAATTYNRLDISDSRLTKHEADTEVVASSNQVAASAVGNFSPEELRDVVKSLRQILKIARDTSKNHLAQALSRVEQLAKLNTLQSIDASVQASTQVTNENRFAVDAAAPDISPEDSSSSSVTGMVSITA